MRLIDDTIAGFGRSLGMDDLTLPDQGGLVLEIDRVGTLAIELIGERREDVSLSLSQQIETPDEHACRRVLELCHYRNPAPWPVHSGLTSRGNLFFAVRLDTSEFTLANVHQVLDWLDGLHQQLMPSVRLV